MLTNEILMVWSYLRARLAVHTERNDVGSVVETVIITAIFAALAIAIGAIIVAKVDARTSTINLN